MASKMLKLLLIPANTWVAVHAAPQKPPTTASPPVSTAAPCEVVASLSWSAVDASPTVYVDYPKIPASSAIACLASVPYNATAAGQWVTSLKTYLSWQSTTPYQRSTTNEYLQFDPEAFLGYIETNIDSYANELSFQQDLYKVFRYARDGHMRYTPWMFGIFAFGRSLPLVSISEDGFQAPKPFVWYDILLSANDTNFTPSPISLINGLPANEALGEIAFEASERDEDAAYNSLFVSLPQLSIGYNGNGGGLFVGGGDGQTFLPESHTNLTFENGTTVVWQNFAKVVQDFTNITTGEELFDKWFQSRWGTFGGVPVSPKGQPPSKVVVDADADADAEAEPTSPPDHIPPPPQPMSAIKGPAGYPQPIAFLAGGNMGGYYINEAGYEDVAVLSLPTFGTTYQQKSMQSTVFNFINQAKSDGKTRLIVDLSANAGGPIFQAYSIFKNLAPDIEPYGASRFRTFQLFYWYGRTVSEATNSIYPWNVSDPPGPPGVLNTFLATPFIAAADMDENGQPFESWYTKAIGQSFNGNNFTSLIRWNLSDPGLIAYSQGFVVNGYGERSNVITERPFAMDDIVILTDGYCASSCEYSSLGT
jgi:hypothetical protein